MIGERHEIMLRALYDGSIPNGLSPESERLFRREATRRQCMIGQAVLNHWPHTNYYARSILSEDYLIEVLQAFPDAVHGARSIVVAIAAAMSDALRALKARPAVWDLFCFESLIVTELDNEILQELFPDRVASTESGPEVTSCRFESDIRAFHSRMFLYAGACAPSQFARAYRVPTGPTILLRKWHETKWNLVPVSHEDRGMYTA